MSRTISLVQRVQIASPCPVSWDSMVGDDRVRFCSQCKLNVYNLSAMTESEGEALIRAKEGKLCGAIYRRADGTVITKDCPVGLAAIRRRVLRSVACAAAAMVCLTTGAGFAMGLNRQRDCSLRTTYSDARRVLSSWLNTDPPPPVGIMMRGDVYIAPVTPPTAGSTAR